MPPVGEIPVNSNPGLTGAWRLSSDTDAIWWSPEMYAIMGVSPEDFTPRWATIAMLLDPATVSRLEERRLAMRTHARPFAERGWFTRRDGERRLLSVRGWCAEEDERSPRVMFGTCQDDTAQAAVRAEQEQLVRLQVTILHAAGDGICGLDADGRITFVNPALLVLMRREDENLTGHRLHDIVHRDGEGRESHPAADCPLAVADLRSASATDTGFHRGDGSRIEVGYMRVGFRDGTDSGAVVSFRDITARRAAARLLQSSLRQVQTLSAQRGALLGHLAAAEERERMRLAADIHDDTIQSLNAVALRLSRAGEGVSGDAERDLLADAELEVRGVAERLRRLMFELLPPDEGRNLRAAVQVYCETLFDDSPLSFELVGEVGELSPERHLVAYRLIQEALRNARAHSQGSRARVSMRRCDDELRLCICDDGVGIGDDAPPPTHAGLRFLRQRAEAAGGTAEFGTGLDGRGTGIRLRLPATFDASA